ncbi:MAG: carboxypeptidase regulatory-like domain-containing protein, partial [Vicinamibacterales bacterium]
LPRANYSLFVRGYGLVDSPRITSARGRQLNLTAVPAPDARAAAQIYPASYWYSLARVPAKSEFPGTGPNGNGINENIKSQSQWLRLMKTDSCESCHQIGNRGTREVPAALGTFPSSAAAWERRVQSGQAGGNMLGGINQMGAKRALAMFADWTDRIKAGELPPAPPRPQGVERNVVITQWDWADPRAYLHDEIATDKRNPSVNANGPLYGSLELSADYIPVLDPVRHTASRIAVPVRDPNTSYASPQNGFMSSPHWGEEVIWSGKTSVHNPILDQRGRLWITSRVRNNDTSAFCRAGSTHPSAKAYPVNQSGRQLAMYDPATKQMTLIDTCYGTHHLFFAEDVNNTLWTSGGGNVVGWLNTKMFDETKDEVRSQGWTPLILDTNGNGKRDAFVEPDAPTDPTKDRRINAGFYGVMPSPKDGSIWASSLGFPGSLVRLVPGPDPSTTALAEMFELPVGNPRADIQAFSPRGMDVDRNGVVWAVMASGHLASFDRTKCKAALNGPTATGQHCPEGWRFYQTPGPQFKGVDEPGSADSHYYNWVDQFDTLGLGRNTPIATGNGSDAMLALNAASGQFTVLRVPYPNGFFAKGMDGRIDDPRAGWKGKGLWSTWATRAPFHTEGGKVMQSKVVKFQMRPDPLAK